MDLRRVRGPFALKLPSALPRPGGMIALMSASHMALEGCHHFLPVAIPLIIAGLGIDYAQIGTLTLIAMGLTAGVQPLFGWLADRWRPDYIIPLSIVWVGGCMSLSGVMPSFPLLSAVVICASLGSAAFHPAAATMTLAHAGPRAGVMFSVFSLGGTLGVAASPLLINYILPSFGLGSTLVYAPMALLMAAALHVGLQRAQAVQPGRAAERDTARGREQEAIPLATALCLALVVMSVMTRSWVHGAFTIYLPSWVLDRTGSATLGGELLAVSAMAAAAGNLLGGVAVDRLSGWKILAVAMALLGGALWGVFHAPAWALMPLVAVIGMAQGATLPVPMLMVRRMIPTRGGLAAALVMGIGWVPSGIGAGVTGALADRIGLDGAMSTLPWPPLLGLALILLFALLARSRFGTESMPSQAAAD